MTHAFRTTLSGTALVACVTATTVGQSLRIDLPSPYVSGYVETLEGEELRYHSPLPWVGHSLLVRSLDRRQDIEWATARVPDGFDGDTAVFVFMVGIDVHEQPRRFDLFVNGDSLLHFTNPETRERRILWEGERGVNAEFRVTLVDKYGDLMGFVFLRVPRALWEETRSLRLRVAGETAGARTWFMVFKDPLHPGATLRGGPAVLRGPDGNRRMVRIDFLYLGDEGHLQMTSPIGMIDTAVTLGGHRFLLPVPAVERANPVPIRLAVDRDVAEATFDVGSVRPFDIHLIHHTHLDIGYTHTQDEVERLQWEHLEKALEYGAAGQGFPEEARFVWNPEGLWAVETYLEHHSQEENARLIDGIRRGWIVLDGMFANLLTGIASSEGLMRSLETSRRLAAVTDVPIRSAMLSDIPGFTWGLVPVLAQHGIQYLSIGPNFGHRIGHFSEKLGDRPFYWESPSGNERVLTWVSGGGYSLFHTGLGYSHLTTILDEELVFGYVDQLVAADYPYDIAYLRYNIGSDNGPPDSTLSVAVREWNERFASPRLIISSTAKMFQAFEERYGNRLPTLRGDLTGYWEDGAASSARETALVRRSAESLLQTEMLAAMLGTGLPGEDLYRAWREVLLYYEHTWGSWNSVSEPEAELTKEQWRQKKQFADSAAVLAGGLRTLILRDRANPSPEAQTVEVFNTANWPRTDIVVLSAEQSRVGGRVLDGRGRAIPSQRLATGELALLAEDVPALGSRRYTIIPEPAGLPTRLDSDLAISNGSIGVTVDPRRGTIASLRAGDTEFVTDAEGGLNAYLYVPSRNPEDVVSSGAAQATLRERGPLVWSIETRAAAPGTNHGVTSQIRLYHGIDRVDIINTVDKTLVDHPEAVLYRFPFAVDDPCVRIDVPWGSFQPNAEQIPGASKNYMSVERWVDIHNDRLGVTFVTTDAPMVQLGQIRTDGIAVGWLDSLPPSATLYSYLMNNYWETNYRAAQDGFHEFKYSIVPHGVFDEATIERTARGIGQPLIAVMIDGDAPPAGLPFAIEADRTVVTLLRRASDGTGFVVRLYNPGGAADDVRFRVRIPHVLRSFRSDVLEQEETEIGGAMTLAPHEILTVKLVESVQP